MHGYKINGKIIFFSKKIAAGYEKYYGFVTAQEIINWPEENGDQLIVDEAAKMLAAENELETEKDSKKRDVELRYRQLISESYSFTVVTEKYYQCDAESQKNLMAGLSYINAGQASIDWSSEDNTRDTFNAAQFTQLCGEIFDRNQNYYVKKKNKKDEIDLLGTIDEVSAYDIEAGWV